MESQKKKQFSLSLLMRIFLGLMVLISVGICANSLMYYNQLNKEAIALEEALSELREVRDELIEDLGSAEELNRILEDYDACQELISSGTPTADVMDAYQTQMDYIRELLNSSKNRNYIIKIAKDELGLYFADEEIFYNDINN